MKSDIRTILRDIQAAARIGHMESLWAALDQLKGIPQIGGNHALNETLINQVILPVGRSIAQTRINPVDMRPLINHPYAAYRAIAGVALVTRFLGGQNQITLKDLNGLVHDPRDDVHLAIQAAVLQTADPDPEKLEALFVRWQGSDSSHIQALAYQLLPHLPSQIALQKINAFRDTFQEYPAEVRRTLASTLSAIGANSYEEDVLELLAFWADQQDPDYKLVARPLTKPWAAQHPKAVVEILTQLAAKIGPQKQIRKAIQNLHRNGAEQEVQTMLEDWRSAESPNLRAAGSDEKLNL